MGVTPQRIRRQRRRLGVVAAFFGCAGVALALVTLLLAVFGGR